MKTRLEKQWTPAIFKLCFALDRDEGSHRELSDKPTSSSCCQSICQFFQHRISSEFIERLFTAHFRAPTADADTRAENDFVSMSRNYLASCFADHSTPQRIAESADQRQSSQLIKKRS